MKTRKISKPHSESKYVAVCVFLLIVIIILLTQTACKKAPVTQPDAGIANYSGSVTITVKSNYLRSVLQVTNITDNVNVLTNNYSGYSGDCPYTKTFTAQSGKTYKIYSYSTKNSADSTLFMVGNKAVWNSLQVQNNQGANFYLHTDSIGTGTWRVCKNNYTIN